MRFLFVVNRNAGRVRATAMRALLEHEFREHEFAIVHEVPCRAELDAANPKPVVVAVGGDGTVQRILHDVGVPFPCPLGILPFGTANDLARSASIPSDPSKACSILRRGSVRAIDVLEVNGVPFVTSGGVGLPVWVASRADCLRRSPIAGNIARRFGRGVYAVATLLVVLARLRRIVGRWVGADDKTRNYSAILVSNLPLLGGFRPSPNADPHDGRFDLCAIEAPRRRSRLAWISLRIYHGSVAECREVRTRQTRRVDLVTERPTPFLGDGEVLQVGTRFEIRVRPGALSLVAPDLTPLRGPSGGD